MIQLMQSPPEGSAIVMVVYFKDFGGIDFTPLTCVWSLSDSKGVIVNSRDRVSVDVEGVTHNFLVSGDDLLYVVDKGKRVFTVEGTYNSMYGTNVPFREEASFSCRNTVVDPLPAAP